MTSVSGNRSLCLRREEIAELTRSKTRACQIRFLTQNGIRHYIDLSGWPVVTLSALGIASQVYEAPKRQTWQPNKALR
jgi:hypothetical protein